MLDGSGQITGSNPRVFKDSTPSPDQGGGKPQTQGRRSANVQTLFGCCRNRLAEIGRRNELRREAKLPLLPIAKELRRMKETEDSQTFSEAFGAFAAKHRQAVWNEVLRSRRELEGLTWRPSWIEGLAYQGEVFRVLRDRFEAERQRG
jgi:hypothetical protein